MVIRKKRKGHITLSTIEGVEKKVNCKVANCLNSASLVTLAAL